VLLTVHVWMTSLPKMHAQLAVFTHREAVSLMRRYFGVTTARKPSFPFRQYVNTSDHTVHFLTYALTAITSCISTSAR